MEDLVAAVAALEKAPLRMISRVRRVERNIDIVLEGIKVVLSKVSPLFVYLFFCHS